ncbi:hypothetical protein D3C86_1687390 [compost metagenome]
MPSLTKKKIAAPVTITALMHCMIFQNRLDGAKLQINAIETSPLNVTINEMMRTRFMLQKLVFPSSGAW